MVSNLRSETDYVSFDIHHSIYYSLLLGQGQRQRYVTNIYQMGIHSFRRDLKVQGVPAICYF